MYHVAGDKVAVPSLPHKRNVEIYLGKHTHLNSFPQLIVIVDIFLFHEGKCEEEAPYSCFVTNGILLTYYNII